MNVRTNTHLRVQARVELDLFRSMYCRHQSLRSVGVRGVRSLIVALCAAVWSVGFDAIGTVRTRESRPNPARIHSVAHARAGPT